MGASTVGFGGTGKNDDIYWYSDDGRLCVLCDAAITQGSFLAAQTCIRTSAELYSKAKEREIDLGEIVARANIQLLEMLCLGEQVGKTTFVAVHQAANGTLQSVNFGDSTAFVVRNGRCLACLKPARRYDINVELGHVSEEAAQSLYDTLPPWMQQKLGIWLPEATLIRSNVQALQVQNGDMVVLCSDGLTDVFGYEELAVALGHLGSSPKEIIQQAVERGSTDDITCVVGIVDSSP